jgi:hypothetical protein
MARQEAAPGWALIFALAVLGLVRPLLSILGAYGSLEKPWGPILVTIFSRRSGCAWWRSDVSRSRSSRWPWRAGCTASWR